VLTWLRELGATVVAFDRSALEPGYALRCAIGVAIPLAIAVLLGHPAQGVAAAIGAFITGFTSLQGIYRTRLAAILSATAGMAVTSLVGAVAANSTVGIVAATAVAGYAYGTVAQLGQVASTVALNSFVAFVLFSSQALLLPTALQQSALVLTGGLIQAVLLLLVWPTARLSVERAALADVYRNLASYANAIAESTPMPPPITPLAAARQVLSDAQPFAHAGEMARFNRMLEDTEAIRKRLGAISAMLAQARDGAGLRDLTRAVSAQLSATAAVLTGGPSADLDRVRNATLAALDRFKGPVGDSLQRTILSDLETHLRDAMQAAAMLATGRLPGFILVSKPRPGPYAENRVAWLGRDSLRPAIVLAVAMLLGRHFAADRGYWIPLTAAIVLRPDLQTTFVRGAARIAGTLVGGLIATLAVTVVRGNAALQSLATVVAAAAAYLTFNPNYALFAVAITSFVVMVLAIRGLPGTTTIEARLLDTLIGGALAMLGYLALPTWQGKRTRALLADLFEAQSRLAGAILRAYAARSEDSRSAIVRARNAAWKLRTTAEAAIDRTRHEPYLRHTIGAGRALRILAATQRFALANVALETGLETLPPIPNESAFAAFADALDATMRELADALRNSRRPRLDDALSGALMRLETELDATPEMERRFIIDQARGYLEAAARLARLVR
jgi:uncharacterized membrane protein YccC